MGSSSSCRTPPRCPSFPLPEWRERLLREVGKDPLAVTRDFSRTPVFISTGSRNNYCDAEESHGNGGGLHGHATACSDALFAARLERVALAVDLLVELCGEAGAFGGAAKSSAAAGDAADPAAALLDRLLTSGMMREEAPATATAHTPLGAERNGATRYGTMGAAERPAKVFAVQSRALRVMQYMVQSVVFFAMQSVSTAVPQDWCRHLQIVAWTVHVFGEAGDVIVVQHKQTLRLHVERHELHHTPRFEIHFTCSIRLNMGELLRNTSAAPEMGSGAEVQSIDIEVHAARVVARPNKLCRRCFLWARRRDELAAAIWENFHVVLEEVAQLPKH